MSTDTIPYILLGVGILVFISVRQLAWQSVNLSKLMRMPVIMFGVGVFMAWKTWTTAMLVSAGPMDITLIAIEIVLAVIGGRVMGNLAQISTRNGQPMTRLRPVGLLIWFGFIALRLGFDALAHVIGADLAGSTVLIMFMLGIVKGVQALTMSSRVNEHQLAHEYAPAGNRI